VLQYIEFRLIGGYGYRQFLDSVVKSEFPADFVLDYHWFQALIYISSANRTQACFPGFASGKSRESEANRLFLSESTKFMRPLLIWLSETELTGSNTYAN